MSHQVLISSHRKLLSLKACGERCGKSRNKISAGMIGERRAQANAG